MRRAVDILVGALVVITLLGAVWVYSNMGEMLPERQPKDTNKQITYYINK